MRSWLFLILPALAMGGLVTWLTDRPQAHQELRVIEQPLLCALPPRFELLDKTRPTTIQERPNGGIAFRADAVVEADFCQPGTLTMTAEGEVAGGEAPVLSAVYNSTELLRLSVSTRREIKLQLTEPGQMTLAYLNDFVNVDARVAFLRLDRAAGAPCLTVQTEGKERRPWSSGANATSIPTGTPVSMTPCLAGPLSFTVSGQAAAGAFPELEFMQAGRVLRKVVTDTRPNTIEVEAGAMPLEIKITNPYYVKNSDRNLNIVRIDFQPGAVQD